MYRKWITEGMGVNDFLWRNEKGSGDTHKRHRSTDDEREDKKS